MEYREYLPPAALAAQVQCIWRLRDDRPAGTVQTIYPDGRCELIVHLAKPPRCWDAESGWHQQARTLFAAQRVVAVRLESGARVDCVGVRLHPAASNSLLPRAAALRDRIVDLATLDASFARSLARAARRFAHGERQTLWKLLATRCDGKPTDTRIAAAVERIELSAGRARIDALARAAALS